MENVFEESDQIEFTYLWMIYKIKKIYIQAFQLSEKSSNFSDLLAQIFDLINIFFETNLLARWQKVQKIEKIVISF